MAANLDNAQLQSSCYDSVDRRISDFRQHQSAARAVGKGQKGPAGGRVYGWFAVFGIVGGIGIAIATITNLYITSVTSELLNQTRTEIKQYKQQLKDISTQRDK